MKLSNIKMLLEKSEFLSRLDQLFSNSKGKGTVYLTMKRFAHKQPKSESEEYHCLVRATMGKVKISTRVDPKSWNNFHEEYIAVCRIHMDSLKKKDRKKNKAAS
jgi:signal recognition particle subunit SRP14